MEVLSDREFHAIHDRARLPAPHDIGDEAADLLAPRHDQGLDPLFDPRVHAGLQGWIFRKTNWVERGLLIAGGLLVIYPVNSFDYVGLGLVFLAVMFQLARARIPVPA